MLACTLGASRGKLASTIASMGKYWDKNALAGDRYLWVAIENNLFASAGCDMHANRSAVFFSTLSSW